MPKCLACGGVPRKVDGDGAPYCVPCWNAGEAGGDGQTHLGRFGVEA